MRERLVEAANHEPVAVLLDRRRRLDVLDDVVGAGATATATAKQAAPTADADLAVDLYFTGRARANLDGPGARLYLELERFTYVQRAIERPRSPLPAGASGHHQQQRHRQESYRASHRPPPFSGRAW